MVAPAWLLGTAVALLARCGPATRPEATHLLSAPPQQVHTASHYCAGDDGAEPAEQGEDAEEHCRKVIAKPFREVHEKYLSSYARGLPRTLEHLRAGDVTIDYEFELAPPTFPLMAMTPETLLMRAGIHPEHFERTGVFDSGSSFLSVDMDGLGSTHSQSLNGEPELNTAVMRPREALGGGWIRDFDRYMGLNFPSRRWRKRRKTGFHYTYGMPLAKVPSLLSVHGDSAVRSLVASAEKVCSGKERGCSPEYRGFLALAAMVLRQAAGCGECRFAKRCQNPWLVRTHFGDLAQRLGEGERSQITDDVLGVWQGRGDQPLYPHGILDYLHFPEMAELGGLVQSRGALEHGKQLTSRVLPTDPQGLLQLAADMLDKKTRPAVQRRLRSRACAINGAGKMLRSSTPTARQWLEAMQHEGKDLMSDHHSPLTQGSLSGTVWRSMGQWRMQPGGENTYRVHLECRWPRRCLGLPRKNWLRRSYNSMFSEPAKFAVALEDR